MAKKTSTTEEQTPVQQLAGQQVSFFIPNTEELGQLENMEDKFSLTMKYKTAEDWAILKDQEIRCYYMGTKEIPNEKEELVTCGVFVTKGECFIAGGKTLVDAVRQLPTKSPISITYRGKKQNKTVDGSTMIFDVKTLG
ncbi:hypothetical protein [Chryseobacterium viscerum]|uniref:Uncharacterized protein n=1 Tax=Chryseobacterium viscerum TaxID=1037377 RepID=A0A5N4BJ65_9FLAO|nr:hypothetical protein [Chryseobacterium viscerum]KAB1228486.1 hypothetical protein F8D52_22705 [Chryseobacterium viscerum]